MKRLINWFINLIKEHKRKRRFKKKVREMKKRDPFVYRH
jgi:hypothetical protein